jgi:hypothetical protein
MLIVYSSDDGDDNNKIGKVYSLEYTDIPKVLFTPYRHITLVIVALL